MRILDRYIFKSILGIFFGCIISFLFLYIVIDLFSHLDDILKQQIHFAVLLRYYLSNLPFIFTQVTPIACLLATLYTFGKLNRDNELIAMRSSGMSIMAISNTVIIFGILLSMLVFLVNDKVVPKSMSVVEEIKKQIDSIGDKQADKKEEIIKNVSMYGLRNRLFFINSFWPAKKTMEGIIILEHDDKQNITKKIIANRGVYADGVWKFYNSITYEFDENGQVINEPEDFQEEIMPIIETPEDFLNQRQKPDFMTISQLDNYIWKLSRSGAAPVINSLKVDLYQRFTLPLTSFIIILLGIPFSLRMRKRATGLSSLGISLMVGFLYYVINAVSIALGKAGILTPLLSVSLSHILALSFSAYFINNTP